MVCKYIAILYTQNVWEHNIRVKKNVLFRGIQIEELLRNFLWIFIDLWFIENLKEFFKFNGLFKFLQTRILIKIIYRHFKSKSSIFFPPETSLRKNLLLDHYHHRHHAFTFLRKKNNFLPHLHPSLPSSASCSFRNHIFIQHAIMW